VAAKAVTLLCASLEIRLECRRGYTIRKPVHRIRARRAGVDALRQDGTWAIAVCLSLVEIARTTT